MPSPDNPTYPPGVWSLAVRHGDQMGKADLEVLQIIRRTLLGLVHHGTIDQLDTYSNHVMTEWSFRPGSEDPAGIIDGLIHVLRVIAPGDWVIMRPTVHSQP